MTAAPRLYDFFKDGHPSVLGVRMDAQDQLVLHLAVPGGSVAVVCQVVEIDGSPPPPPATKEERETLYRSRRSWVPEVLADLNLPLIWSRRWLYDQLIKHRSLDDIASATGYPKTEVMRWKKRHNISGNPGHERIIDEWKKTELTRSEFMDLWGISATTISNLVGDVRRGDPRLNELRCEIRKLIQTGLSQPAEIFDRLGVVESADRSRVYRLIRRVKAAMR